MPANKVGISLATVGVLSDVDTTQRNMLGASVEDETGGVYVYLQGVASTVAGDWVIYNSATFLTTRLVTAILAGPIAVAMAALLLTNFGWYQIGGIVLSANIASDAAQQALFEGTQQPFQRYETQDMKAGFKALMFKTAQYVFSQYGNASNVFFLNPKNFNLVVSKEFFRDRGDTQEIPNANGFNFKIYSALQTVTTNRSRLGTAHL